MFRRSARSFCGAAVCLLAGSTVSSQSKSSSSKCGSANCPRVPLSQSDAFHEEMLVIPMEDGSVMTHLQFELLGSGADNDFVFLPKSLVQIARKYNVSELEATLTTGRWNLDRWGAPSTVKVKAPLVGDITVGPHIAPVGAEVWAWFGADGSPGTEKIKQAVDASWGSLQKALSGLICASINEIKELKTTAGPQLQRVPSLALNQDAILRYAQLPRENVCTENLTPWVKLLPCRNQAGLGAMLSSIPVVRADYQSLSVHLRPLQISSDTVGWHASLSLTVVHHSSALTLESSSANKWNWVLPSVFRAVPVLRGCSVATTSNARLLLPGWLKKQMPASFQEARDNLGIDHAKASGTKLDQEKPSFNVLPMASDVSVGAGESIVLRYDLHRNQGLDRLSMQYADQPRGSQPVRLFSPPAPAGWAASVSAASSKVRLKRFLGGMGDHMGTLNIEITNFDSLPRAVRYFDSLQWFVRLFFHTLSLKQNGIPLELRLGAANDTNLRWFRFQPATYRDQSSEIELELLLPPRSVTLLTVDFEKTFLEHDAFPPDVSRGLDIASALLTVAPASSFEGVMPGQVLRLYSEPLLLLMPFPDGSMPFNVIAFSCTVLAFIFGSMFNLLFASDESVLRGKAKSPLKRAIAATIAKLKKKYGSTRSSTPRKVEDENSIRAASNPEDLQKSTKEQKPSHDAKAQDEPEHASDLSASPNKAGPAISPKSSITAAVFGIKATPSPPRNRRSSPRRQNAAAAAANPIE